MDEFYKEKVIEECISLDDMKRRFFVGAHESCPYLVPNLFDNFLIGNKIGQLYKYTTTIQDCSVVVLHDF